MKIEVGKTYLTLNDYFVTILCDVRTQGLTGRYGLCSEIFPYHAIMYGIGFYNYTESGEERNGAGSMRLYKEYIEYED